MARQLAVVGGTGFLGSNVCRLATQSGLRVISISRSGVPPPAVGAHHFSKDVDWKSVNVLEDPEGLKESLEGCDAVVIAVGALFAKSGYKRLANLGGQAINRNNETGSHEQINRDTALRVLDVVAKFQQLQHVTFVSAGNTLGAMHVLNTGYLDAKREAEDAVLTNESVRVATVLRPGIMYSDARPVSILAGGFVKAKRGLLSNIPALSWAVQDDPLPVETVAAACVQSVCLYPEDEGREWPEHANIYDIDGIVALSQASCSAEKTSVTTSQSDL